MTLQRNLFRSTAGVLLLAAMAMNRVPAQAQGAASRPASRPCRIEPTNYKGWNAEQISNRWVQLIVVPQNGGRLMQVVFNGHSYLFVNPKYEGKYFPPDPGQWFNYGGDKLWPLPEGNDDEQHWAGGSDILDDGAFSFRKVSEGGSCEIELTGPADPQTGLQFRRTMRLDAESSRIRFHATMTNISGHRVEWSMQSVSQYNTANAQNPSQLNRDFWTFAPVNPASSYLNRYHVRFGPAENPAVRVRPDGLFALHYVHMAAELWLDSSDGWLAVLDGSSGYGMVERFQYESARKYPGNASIIFWTNGPQLKLSPEGQPSLTSGDEDASPYYLEAEINSPLCRLGPGESCELETEWFPTRAGSEVHGATDTGIVVRPLRATRLESGKIRLSGSFGVFFSGRLVARLYRQHGAGVEVVPLIHADPAEPVTLETEVAAQGEPARVSVHLEDETGLDRGALQEVPVGREDRP